MVVTLQKVVYKCVYINSKYIMNPLKIEIIYKNIYIKFKFIIYIYIFIILKFNIYTSLIGMFIYQLFDRRHPYKNLF